jgi:hypothetical protein
MMAPHHPDCRRSTLQLPATFAWTAGSPRSFGISDSKSELSLLWTKLSLTSSRKKKPRTNPNIGNTAAQKQGRKKGYDFRNSMPSSAGNRWTGCGKSPPIRGPGKQSPNQFSNGVKLTRKQGMVAISHATYRLSTPGTTSASQTRMLSLGSSRRCFRRS